MSTQYNIEPNPTAKALLVTTAGEIEVEIFAKQTPLTARNFLQHCLDGYYDNTIFHRVVPKFVIQGGDPTGTGSGGASIYENGLPFKDEFHSRLKFNRRGLLGMANRGNKDDNQSQFFFTLDATPELTGKNTMFGRVVGDTWYNILKMVDQAENSGMVEGTERPLFPSKIIRTEVLVNYFDDMVKRDLKPQQMPEEKKEQKKPKRKANAALLSFGFDDAAEAAPLRKKQRANPKLVYAGEEDPVDLNNPPMPSGPKDKTQKAVMQAVVPQNASPSPPPAQRPSRSSKSLKRDPSPPSDEQGSESEPERPHEDVITRTNRQIEELKASMRRNGPAALPTKPEKKSALEAMVPSTSIRGRKRGAGPSAAEEERSAALLAAFKSRLDHAPDEEPPVAAPPQPDARNGHRNGPAAAETAAEADDAEAAVCDLHFIPNCQSCSKWDEQDAKLDEDVGEGWMNHQLTFEKDRLGKDLEWKRKNEEELLVIDPRVKEKELGIRSKDKDGDKRRGGLPPGARDREKDARR